MRIATWNVERLKHKDKLDLIHEACDAAEADNAQSKAESATVSIAS